MAKTKPKAEKAAPKSRPAPHGDGWSTWGRAVVSVLVVWHLFVLFISPLSVPPTSPLVGSIAQSPYVTWYSDPLYLNHGYHFFGPDPPTAGQLIRYQVFGDDGQTIAEGEFPNRQQQWPRLFYHRHMMLADQASGVGIIRVSPDRIEREYRQRQSRDPRVTFAEIEQELTTQENARLMLQAYARNLLRKHNGIEARLAHVRHLSLHPADVRNDINPSNERFFPVLQSVTVRANELQQPLLPADYPARLLEELPPGAGGQGG